jgi:very-short-patch-repair endonuclease
LTDKNSLEVRAPWLAKEYHPDNPIPFAEMTFGSRKGVVWICSKNSNHTWVATPNSRTYSKTGCPHCSFQHSKAELAIFAAVKEKRPDALNGKRGELKSKLLELDVFVPSLRKAIEYDGTYYHPVGQERDVRKNQQCIEAGISLLRVLEAEYEADPAAALLKIFQWLALPPPTD